MCLASWLHPKNHLFLLSIFTCFSLLHHVFLSCRVSIAASATSVTLCVHSYYLSKQRYSYVSCQVLTPLDHLLCALPSCRHIRHSAHTFLSSFKATVLHPYLSNALFSSLVPPIHPPCAFSSSSPSYSHLARGVEHVKGNDTTPTLLWLIHRQQMGPTCPTLDDTDRDGQFS